MFTRFTPDLHKVYLPTRVFLGKNPSW